MAQLTVYQNKNPQTRSAVPFLLDIQNDLLSDLETRVVVPLRPLTVRYIKALPIACEGLPPPEHLAGTVKKSAGL